MKKIVQNNFYRVQLINNIWFEKKGDMYIKFFNPVHCSDFILKILHYYCILVYTHLNFLLFLYTVFTALILSALDTTTQNFWKTLREIV